MSPVKIKPRMTEKVRTEIAHYLVMRYAPGAELRVQRATATPKVTIGEAESADPNVIVWAPRDGLTSLLHEIGHHRLEGHAPPGAGLEVLREEAAAWVWAEWAAWQECLWFDYAYAARCFAGHVTSYAKETGREFPIRLDWRRR